jgi:hypothetical protein
MAAGTSECFQTYLQDQQTIIGSLKNLSVFLSTNNATAREDFLRVCGNGKCEAALNDLLDHMSGNGKCNDTEFFMGRMNLSNAIGQGDRIFAHSLFTLTLIEHGMMLSTAANVMEQEGNTT